MRDGIIYGHEHVLLPWVGLRIGVNRFRSDAYSIGLMKRGEIVAAVVYDTFSAADCFMHVASDGTKLWLSKAFLFAAFGYPFTQLRLRRVSAMIAASNKDALRFNKSLGFVDEGYHPHALPNDDVISRGMLRENCRFIVKENS